MRIVLLGPPGSGKGELARSISKHYGIPQLTLAGTLNDIAVEKTEMGRLVREAAALGKFSDELIMAALRIRLAKADARKGFVMEDFPRTTGQATTLDILLKGLKRPLDTVLRIAIDSDDLMEKLVGRITCESCGAQYNVYINPPIVDGMCDVCGEKIRRKPDDYEENIANRLRVCEMQVAPIVDYYQKQEKLLDIDGNQSAKKMFRQASQIIDRIPVTEVDDIDESVLPMDESLIKALMAPSSGADPDKPRRRGRPRKIVPEVASDDAGADSKAAGVTKKQQEKKKKAAKKSVDQTPKATGKKTTKKVAKKKVAKTAVKKKSAVSKKTSKKTTTKPAPAKKAAAGKKVAKKASKKTTVKKAVSKAASKKAAAKKVSVKKKAAKKTPVKKTAVKKQVVKKKVAVKKQAKKKAAKKSR